MASDAPPKQVSVMVTRPAKQAEKLCQMIEEAGARAIRFPVIEIEFIEADNKIRPLIEQLETFQLAIFISVNAVRGAARVIQHALPDGLQLAAVGRATAKAVAECWQREVITPAQQSNSEGLLALPRLQNVRSDKIIIFRGRGGRELLADELTKRGAKVCYAEVYRRTVPDTTLAVVESVPIDLVIVTSNEGLQNLYDIAGAQKRGWLLAKQLIVISQRTADLAKQLGFLQPPIIAPSADDPGLLAAVLAWKTERDQN